MLIKKHTIKEYADFHIKSAKYNLDYFNEIISIVLILNDQDILKKDCNYEIVDQFGNDIFKDEIEKLISNIYLDKETNLLYQKILKLAPEEFIDEDEYSILKLSEVKIKKLRLEYYYNSVLYILSQFTNALEKIRSEYDLKNISEKIKHRTSILYDSKINLYSPLLFNHEQWTKVILNELMLSNSLEEAEKKKRKFIENLIELKSLLPNSLVNFPSIDINETTYWLHYWNENKVLFVYPIILSIRSKIFFLESLSNSKLKRLFNKELIKRYNEAKRTVKELKNQLRRKKIEVKHKKNIQPIIKGLSYLLSKQNPNLLEIELLRLSKQIVENLFYLKDDEPKENQIDPAVKINKVVLIEFILYLKNKKHYLVDKKMSIPRIIRDNLNYKSKGFSYQNLSKIYSSFKYKNEFNFDGLTSETTLKNEMK